MAAADVLYIDNTNNVWIEGLKSDVTGTVIADATCTIVEILDAAGTPVTGTTDIAMTYRANGDYYGQLPHTVVLTEDAEYTVRARAVDQDGNRGEWRRKVRAVYRNS